MLYTLKKFLTRFRDDTQGVITVEAMITLPIMLWALAATYEFFEMHRYKSAREKATYTVADMLSRETMTVNEIYLDNVYTLFTEISNDNQGTQIRMSVLQFDEDANEYSVFWSKVRGPGEMEPLVNADVANAHDTLPITGDGIYFILIESNSAYDPLFQNVGVGTTVPIKTRVFTSIRFSTNICFEGLSQCG